MTILPTEYSHLLSSIPTLPPDLSYSSRMDALDRARLALDQTAQAYRSRLAEHPQALQTSSSEQRTQKSNRSHMARTKQTARSRIAVVDDDDEAFPLSQDHGKIAEVKDLYQSKPDDNGMRSWTIEVPTDTAGVAENSETAKYALLVRKDKCYDGRRQYTINSIVIQSPLLKDVLSDIFKDYTGVTINVRRLEFYSPWHSFIHCWNKLVETKNNLSVLADKAEGDEAALAIEKRNHIALLHNVLNDDLRDVVNRRNDLMSEGVMSYDLIWTLFEPGSIVVSGIEAYRLICSNETQHGHQVQVQYIDWNGTNFGHVTTCKYIYPFTGTRPISQLAVYPFSCHKDKEGFKQKVLARARKFESLCGFRYQQYDGPAEYDTPCGRSKHTVNGRIVLDTESWNTFNANQACNIATLPINPEPAINGNGADHDAVGDINELTGTTASNKVPANTGRLTEEQLLLTTATLRGYSSRDKKWMYFGIENISDVTWDEHAFDDLVLPEKQKELVRSIAESQAMHSRYFDDIIQGKGQGIVLLLAGPPGVGKTLTAESVAEVMKVPLYYMSTIDMGSDAASVESALGRVFKMVTKWNAVLLLDEADVFLEQRTTHDLERNKLVSVFLRILEYYKGLLFLTTNRGDTIDDAFQSRIHLRLTYSALSIKSRSKIWRGFIKGLSYKHHISDHDFEGLAKRNLNGRQIKNLLKTAVLLAARKGETLRKNHIEFVLEIDQQA